MSEYELWFAKQPFYVNMAFMHGDGLFIKDDNVYRCIGVQIGWSAWQIREQQIKTAHDNFNSTTQKYIGE